MHSNEASGCERADIARAANKRIWEFVHQRANRDLRAGTGYYSTPFRGGLYGKVKSSEVASRLGRGVDVLWLGTNPGVPRSLANIISPPKDGGDLPGFARQMDSGFFGSSRWGPDGTPEADFSPIEAPTGAWRIYRDIFGEIGRLDRVAMANFIPWGSKNAEALTSELGHADRPLLRRALEFADDLNAEIVEALAPRLAVVPFSLGRNRTLNATARIGLSLKEATNTRSFAIPLGTGTFNFYTAVCQRGAFEVRTAFVPHPASLRLSSESKIRVISEVAAVLQNVL